MRIKFKKHFKKPISLAKLIPNLITIMGLSIGISSLRYALDEKWENALSCIIIAAIFDSMDGRIARLLKASSKFGAELDSLSDLVNFGVCPGLIIYLWALYYFKYKLLAWIIIVFFVVCIAIRLARFNIISAYPTSNSEFYKYFFMGVPAPISGILALMPIIFEIEIGEYIGLSIKSNFLIIIPYFLIIGILAASTVPTFSFKNLKLHPKYIWIFLISFGLIAINLIMYPWYILPILSVAYISTIPLSVYKASTINKSNNK